MKQGIVAVAILAANVSGIASAQGAAWGTGSASLPGNSEVWVSPSHEISSKVLREGGTFPVAVTRDVMMGDQVAIPHGTPGHGRVTWRTGKGAFGKSAKMEFELVDLQLAGRIVPIAGHYRIEGEGNTGATLGAIALAGVIAGAAVTGHSAVADAASEWKAYTRAPIDVGYTAPRAIGRAAVIDPYEAGRAAGRAAAATIASRD